MNYAASLSFIERIGKISQVPWNIHATKNLTLLWDRHIWAHSALYTTTSRNEGQFRLIMKSKHIICQDPWVCTLSNSALPCIGHKISIDVTMTDAFFCSVSLELEGMHSVHSKRMHRKNYYVTIIWVYRMGILSCLRRRRWCGRH